ncbi:hypothetical protein NAEGRDRAFT_35199 [Naegleria gruberi]|uniref:Fe2OG dioxygenase domain-containing protein n=1 Tax=Naegleria gruberi TaxID=5762 RepID=D2V223_NAEGR|nr:uncharacterized protein NAEGRDRAFT_35199 [Naegleria gruberi]EFC48978.1 hypothetical protein NAEGRDRAFT_35199 [Naegleria gruberi]|eukprot:XP_002681722.1 hypothetical protein NAEGRDRAFT_35199 [Naegleria gruberi strain NEG-M]
MSNEPSNTTPEEEANNNGSSPSSSSSERDTLTFVNKEYNRLHKDLFEFDEKFLNPTFAKACKDAKELHYYFDLLEKAESEEAFNTIKKEFNQKKREILLTILTEEVPQVYSLEIFTPEFSQKMIEEKNNYEKNHHVKLRPNSMNNYGIVIDEIGLGKFFDVFIVEYLCPLAKIMNPAGFDLDDHHTFFVEYFIGGDKDLNVHVDDAELTLNVCLGKPGFEGGNLFFRGHRDNPKTYNQYFEYQHVVGRAVMHDGALMHGALPLTKGERVNLIIWARSTEMRRQIQEAIKEMQEQGHHHCCQHDHHHEHEHHEHHHHHEHGECCQHEHHHEHSENCQQHEHQHEHSEACQHEHSENCTHDHHEHSCCNHEHH